MFIVLFFYLIFYIIFINLFVYIIFKSLKYTFKIIFGIINLFVYITFKFLKYTFKIIFGIINLFVYIIFKSLKYTFKIMFGIINLFVYIIFKFLKYTFKIIFGIINLFVYIIFKFLKYTFKITFGIFKLLKYIFKFIIGTNKHKEKYDKKILSQAVNKVFLNNVRKKTARNIFSDTDLNATLSKQLYNYVDNDNEKIITDKIKNYFKDKISFLFSIFYVRDSTEHNYNNFKRITDKVIDNLNNKNDEILEEYRKIKYNY